MSHYDVIIIGAGAAGLMSGYTAGKRGKKTLILEHTPKIGEKIRISGGGRCNFTNINPSQRNYISQNPHFCVSALNGYTPKDFISLLETFKIAYHEKTLGQLFCDGSAKQIISMFETLCQANHVTIQTGCTVQTLSKGETFRLETTKGTLTCDSLIIATGGLSIPLMGASDFGYRIARQFGLKVVETRPALVPLTVCPTQKSLCTDLSGIAVPSRVSYHKTDFLENILFTHRGLSGPAILQISSYLENFTKQPIIIDLSPTVSLKAEFITHRTSKKTPANFLKQYLPNRLVDNLVLSEQNSRTITEMKNDTLFKLAQQLHTFTLIIDGSEGYQKAEVTKGGVDTNALSSQTMMCKDIPNLFFVGEVVDVTGWLGGYNFQWAWSSGHAAGANC